jgi:hypothetical protein
MQNTIASSCMPWIACGRLKKLEGWLGLCMRSNYIRVRSQTGNSDPKLTVASDGVQAAQIFQPMLCPYRA